MQFFQRQFFIERFSLKGLETQRYLFMHGEGGNTDKLIFIPPFRNIWDYTTLTDVEGIARPGSNKP